MKAEQAERAICTLSKFCREYYKKHKGCKDCPIYDECRSWWVSTPDMWREGE